MKTKFTSGEWMTTMFGNSHVVVTKETNTFVADCGSLAPHREANVRLIATAPELVKALQELIEEFDRNHQNGVPGDYVIDQAKDVLNKALGINEPQNA